MARIYVEPEKARRTVQDELELAGKLSDLSQQVSEIRSNLRYKIAGREQISSRLQEVAEQISRESASARGLSSALQQVLTQYEQTENNNRDRLVTDEAKTEGPGIGVADGIEISRQVIPGYRPDFDFKEIAKQIDWTKLFPFFTAVVSPNPISILQLLADKDSDFKSEFLSWESEDGNQKGKVNLVSNSKTNVIDALKDQNRVLKDIDDWKKSHQKDLASGKYYIDTDTNTIKKVDVNDPNDPNAGKEFAKHNKGTLPIDFRVAGVGASKSAQVWGTDGEFTGGIGGVSGSVSAVKGEYHSEAYVGALGIGAGVGASFCLFNASGKAYLGNEDAQLYVKGDVTAGKVGAEVGASAGLIDKDGDFNPSLYAGASAEAIAGEVSGAVGGKVLGTDVAVKGSLNYGIGAHANVGMHDGKISVDVGATLGVGVGVKLDIDVSGTVKAVGDAISNVGSFISDLF